VSIYLYFSNIDYSDLPRQVITSNPVRILHRFGTWQGPAREFVDLFNGSVDDYSKDLFCSNIADCVSYIDMCS
jgi:hypothetical protein